MECGGLVCAVVGGFVELLELVPGFDGGGWGCGSGECDGLASEGAGSGHVAV